MPTLLISRTACSVRDIVGADSATGSDFCCANQLPVGGVVPPATPLLLSPAESESRHIMRSMRAMPLRDRYQLADAVEHFGDLTVPIAAFFDRYFSQGNGLVGAGATAVGARVDGFQAALGRYQEAILKLHEGARQGAAAGPRRVQLESDVRASHRVLNQQFQAELKRFIPAADFGKNRGSALTSAERGIAVARRRAGRELYVSNLRAANQLAGFAKVVRAVGNKAIVVDAGLRGLEVDRIRREGGDWMREASIQATGFGFGGATGIFAGKVTVAAVNAALVSLGLAITPVGWVLIISIGLAAAFGTAMVFDGIGKSAASTIWDRRF